MDACIILHNKIVENEREEYESILIVHTMVQVMMSQHLKFLIDIMELLEDI